MKFKISIFLLVFSFSHLILGQKLTISADFSQSMGKWNCEPGSALSTVSGQFVYHPDSWTFIRTLKLKKVRLWSRIDQMNNIDTKQPNYNLRKAYYEVWRDASDTLLLNWQTQLELTEPNRPNPGDSPRMTPEEHRQMTIASLTYLKTLCPSLAYIEIENELMDAPMTDNYRRYKFMYPIIQELNNLNLPGPKIKIGGPVTSTYSDYYTRKWLTNYKNDTDPNKRIDFFAWHEYVFNDKDNIASILNQRERLNTILDELELSNLKNLPVHVSETGIFQSEKVSGLSLEEDLHIQAAGMATMAYYHEEMKGIHPYHWTILHPDNPRKNMFVGAKTDGIPRPFALLMKLQRMIPETRITVNNFLNEKGIGVGSFAGLDNETAVIMSWNYQYDQVQATNNKDTEVKFINLPKEFYTHRVRVTQYTIPSEVHQGDLTILYDKELDQLPTNFKLDISLSPNAIQMTKITILQPSGIQKKKAQR